VNLPDDISLAQWSLIEEWRSGKWTTLDFPRLARADFGLNGVEFVNTLFEVPTEGYLRQLRQNAAAHGITWAAESYQPLIEYAKPAGIKILIENHGGLSNDPDWMINLMRAVNDPFFGTYPDWREPTADFDNLTYLEKTLPFAKGMSYRNQPTDELSVKMIDLCRRSGFHGWYGIESGGRAQIKRAIRLLKAHLPGTSPGS
jgi:hypothetical protein